MTFSKREILLGGAAMLALAACSGPPADLQSVATGAQAPAFSIADASGAVRTLAEFTGRHVILEWTNNGCPYVRKHSTPEICSRCSATPRRAAWFGCSDLIGARRARLSRRPGAIAPVATDQATVTATLLDPEGVMGRAYGALNTPQMVMRS